MTRSDAKKRLREVIDADILSDEIQEDLAEIATNICAEAWDVPCEYDPICVGCVHEGE